MRAQQQTKHNFGVMQMERRTEDIRPHYYEALFRAGFLPYNATTADAWAMWTRLCEDKVVTKMARELEQPNPRYRLLASIISGYSRYKQVLAAMSPRQKKALKLRLGVHQ